MAKFWSLIAILAVVAAGFAFLKMQSDQSRSEQSAAGVQDARARLDELEAINRKLREQLDQQNAVAAQSSDDPLANDPQAARRSRPETGADDTTGVSLTQSLDDLLALADTDADTEVEDDLTTSTRVDPLAPPAGHKNTGMPHKTDGTTPWEELAAEFKIDLADAMGEDSSPGTGTRDDPKRLSWDVLAGASQTFKPRDGQEELPQEIIDLDGTYVKLSGYYLFPMAGDEFDEVLMMRNMWDGCCIGVPPTAFSAVLVKLNEPMKRGRMWAMSVGTVKGRMVIDPMVDRGWILSLYVIEEGSLVTDEG
jgi:hypothetical protein